jgi:type III secretory pathway component EscS
MSDGTAILLLYGGPPTLIALMFGYGITLLQTKVNQSPPSTLQKMVGWLLILLSISIVALFIASKMKK